MKKMLFVVFVIFVGITYGQNTDTIKGYQKGLEFNYSGLADYSGGDHIKDHNTSTNYFNYDMRFTIIDKAHSFNFNFVNGYRFNPYLFLGGGVGLRLISFNVRILESNTSIHWSSSFELKEISLQIPLFVRFHANFTPKKVSPFASLDFGGNICVYNDYDEINRNFFGHNIFFMPALGVNISFKQMQNLYVAFIYDLSFTPKNDNYIAHINHSVGARVGFNF